MYIEIAIVAGMGLAGIAVGLHSINRLRANIMSTGYAIPGADAGRIREKALARDPWSRIAALIPGTSGDFAVLREHWRSIDEAMDHDGITVEEEALRRTLRVDLPRIADTLEGAMAVARGEEERRTAAASALGSLEDLLRILTAQRKTVFAAAASDQRTVGRYLETKRDDFDPSGPLSLDGEPPMIQSTLRCGN